MNIDDTVIESVRDGIAEYEELSPNFLVFCYGVHAFLWKLHETLVIKKYAITMYDNNELNFSIEFENGKRLDDIFQYDKENYNGSSSKS